MIRGKAFEFTVLSILQQTLSNRLSVSKKVLNPQLGSHDEDITVIDLQTQLTYRIECKLAKKGSYRYLPKEQLHRIEVKCMRSRTLGKEMQERLAPLMGVSVEQLGVHNDQYRASDFELLITSIGNAFYETDDMGLFIWNPDKKGVGFLQKLSSNPINNIQNFAFHKLYVAKSTDLLPRHTTDSTQDIICSRSKCQSRYDCGFIPNYPKIFFEDNSPKPNPPWYDLSDIELLLA